MNTEKIRCIPCYSLRYYGEPVDGLTLKQMNYISAKKQREKEIELEKKLDLYKTPDNLAINELIDFMYLQACLYLNKKPVGNFEGDAEICARVMSSGGDIVDMYESGANAYYCFCLSSHELKAPLATIREYEKRGNV